MNVIANVVPIAHSRLDAIARRIQEGHARATKSDEDWIEGTLQVAAALLDGRENVPANVAFGKWLKDQGLDFYGKNARAALIGFAGDLGVARTVLSECAARTRCYENIWRDHKNRFPANRKTAGPRARRRRSDMHRSNRAMNYRRAKLGDDLIDSIKGTTLDRADEMDELVMLNRGAPEGEHTAMVKRLVADAVAGKDVSAIAATAQLGTSNLKKPALIAAWRKRMVAAWEQATGAEQTQLIEYLIDHHKKVG